MVKLGSDWAYIGLGIGAVYLVYKLTKPVTDLTSSIAEAGNQVLTGASETVANTSESLFNKIKGTEKPANPSQWFTASVPTLFNKAVDSVSNINLSKSSPQSTKSTENILANIRLSNLNQAVKQPATQTVQYVTGQSNFFVKPSVEPVQKDLRQPSIMFKKK